MISTLILAVRPTTPHTVSWSPSVALIMIFCNLLVIAIGLYAVRNRGAGPDIPVDKPALWKNFGFPELLATTSVGHILGAGMILGLSNAGIL